MDCLAGSWPVPRHWVRRAAADLLAGPNEELAAESRQPIVRGIVRLRRDQLLKTSAIAIACALAMTPLHADAQQPARHDSLRRLRGDLCILRLRAASTARLRISRTGVLDTTSSEDPLGIATGEAKNRKLRKERASDSRRSWARYDSAPDPM